MSSLFFVKNIAYQTSRPVDEITLMVQVAQGDLAKLGILYERYKVSLFAYFYRVTCGDQSTSEDLVHQVFMRVINYKHTFKGHGSFAKWLFHIAHHVAIDYSKATRISTEPEHWPMNTAYSPTPHEALEEQEKINLLHWAMQQLRDEDREVIVLGKVECLKYQDIAEIMQMTEGAVRVKIHRALLELKKIYSKLENQ